MENRPAKSGAHLITAFAIIAGVAVASVLVGAILVGQGIDASVRARDAQSFNYMLAQRGEHLEQILAQNAIWDEAAEHVGNQSDAAWVERDAEDLMSGAAEPAKSLLVTLDVQGRVLYASLGKNPAPSAETAELLKQTLPLIQHLRDVEDRNKGPLAGDRSFQHGGGYGVVMLNGKPYLAAAELVQSATSNLHPSYAHAPIFLLAEPFGAPLLNYLSAPAHISGLHIGETEIEPGAASLTWHTLNGAAISLHWTPDTPAGHVLSAIGPYAAVILILLFGAGLLLLRRSLQANESLALSEARAKHLAWSDQLTGLPNRVLFQDRLTQSIDRLRRSNSAIAVFCLDLDNFKDINDTYGYEAGDELIRIVATRLQAVSRAGDTVARFGGDEFTIIQHDSDLRSADALARRILETLSGHINLAGGRPVISCSVGATLVSEGGVEPAEVLRQADLALNRAKSLGRRQACFFEPEMDLALKRRKSLEADLRQALADEALEVVYQPQVNAKGAVIGVEALVRWNHPVRGAVSPAFFVPIAEQSGLIETLGAFVMGQAFIDSLRWPHLKVAVNVSAIQLRSPGFVDRVKALCVQTGANPNRLEIEITEGVLLGDDSQVQGTLGELRAAGFSIALDDFGTGYSSLSYLRRYAVDKIKIDRSFIMNLETDPEAEAVVLAILRLAKALSLDVVAEGVETSAQRQRLIKAGCDVIQGFLFSRPVAAALIDGMAKPSETFNTGPRLVALK